MQLSEQKSYSEFFKEDLYGGFVEYLLDNYTARLVNDMLKNDKLVTKRGVHPAFARDFNRFLQLNPAIEREFANNNKKFLQVRNIIGEPIRFPIDPSDDGLMVREGIRNPLFVPASFKDAPRERNMIKSAGQMRGTTISGNGHGKKYRVPKRLTIHFKDGFAKRIGKTTETFIVESRSEAMSIILDRFEKKVAYARIQNEEEFCFVKPKDGKKRRRHTKLRSSV